MLPGKVRCLWTQAIKALYLSFLQYERPRYWTCQTITAPIPAVQLDVSLARVEEARLKFLQIRHAVHRRLPSPHTTRRCIANVFMGLQRSWASYSTAQSAHVRSTSSEMNMPTEYHTQDVHRWSTSCTTRCPFGTGEKTCETNLKTARKHLRCHTLGIFTTVK